jgi:hypothetical protein
MDLLLSGPPRERKVDPMALIADIFKQIDVILRGKHTDHSMQQLLVQANELLVWASQLDRAAHLDANQNSEIAVKLFNKIKNLEQQSAHGDAFSELESVLKAVVAWMSLNFLPISASDVAKILKLLCRAADGLNDLQMQKYETFVAKLCDDASQLWGEINIEALTDALSTMELADIRLALFRTLLMQMKLLARSNLGITIPDGMKRSVLLAKELSYALQLPQKGAFAETVIDVAISLAHSKLYEDAIKLFAAANDIISLASSTTGNSASSRLTRESIYNPIASADVTLDLGVSMKHLSSLQFKSMILIAYCQTELK